MGGGGGGSCGAFCTDDRDYESACRDLTTWRGGDSISKTYRVAPPRPGAPFLLATRPMRSAGVTGSSPRQPSGRIERCTIPTVKRFSWNPEKNRQLHRERGISFEEILFHMETGDLVDVVDHSNPEKYPGQRIFVIAIDEYAYLVPFVESGSEIFLKTIIPSRKATRRYLGGRE